LTTLVILVLIAIWATVLIYPILRARTEGGFGDSIGTFRRHLSVLERAAPNSVSPANRLRLPQSSSGIPPYRAGVGARAGTGAASRSAGGRRYSPPVAPARRRKLQKRRRDVLFTLVTGIIGSLLLGLIPGLSMMLFVCAGFVLLLAGYVALLARLRSLATEREMKLTFLPRAAPAQVALGESAAERQRIAGGGGYTLPDGYGARSDMLMRRRAN
jgi:hypothetical protein